MKTDLRYERRGAQVLRTRKL